MTEAEPRNQREMTTAVLIARPAPPLACLPPLAIRCWPSPRRAAVAAPEVRRGLQLLAGECDQRPEVSLGICGPERRDVVAAQSARFGERSTAPGEPCAAECHDERIRGQPRPAAVTVREWVDDDEPVAESDRALVAAISCRRGVSEPRAHVAKDVAHVHVYLPVRHAEVSVGGPVASRPGPDLAVHPEVQAL